MPLTMLIWPLPALLTWAPRLGPVPGPARSRAGRGVGFRAGACWPRVFRPGAGAHRGAACSLLAGFSALIAGHGCGGQLARLGLAAAAGLVAGAVPAEHLARRAAVSHALGGAHGIGATSPAARRRAGGGRRLRPRCWLDRTARAVPASPHPRAGMELASDLVVCAALPLCARAPGRHLGRRLVGLFLGLPVPAAREHGPRAGESKR